MTAPHAPTLAPLDYLDPSLVLAGESDIESALAVTRRLVAAALALGGRTDPAWWGGWSRPSFDGRRFVYCEFCGRQGPYDGDASTVKHSADCDADALDRARADYLAWSPDTGGGSGDGEGGEVGTDG